MIQTCLDWNVAHFGFWFMWAIAAQLYVVALVLMGLMGK